MNPQVADLLREAGTRLPGHEARELLASALGRWADGHGPAAALLWDAPDAAQAGRFRELVDARAAGEPLQYLTGQATFRTVDLSVGPGVFVPRPETETVAGWAIDALRAMPGAPVVVELCAGSGAISRAIAAEAPGCRQHAVERDASAIAYARRNLADTAVRLVQGDMADAFPELDGRVDLVVVNPPYVPETDRDALPLVVRREPPEALFAGPDGLDAIGVVAVVAARLLRPGGLVACEHGDDQGESAPAVFAAARVFDEIVDHSDLTGRPRFVTARLGVRR